MVSGRFTSWAAANGIRAAVKIVPRNGFRIYLSCHPRKTERAGGFLDPSKDAAPSFALLPVRLLTAFVGKHIRLSTKMHANWTLVSDNRGRLFACAALRR